MFVELPDVDDIAVQDQLLRLDGFKITAERLSLAAVSSQMHIGNYSHFYLPFFHAKKLSSKEASQCWWNIKALL